jgi:ubiquinone biosynthesis protein UbiJ
MKKNFLPLLSKAINTYLGLDPESKQRLHDLQGKAIAIELKPFHFIFQCVFTSKGVSLHQDDEIETEATLRGTPLQLAGAMLAKENRQQFFADDLIMEGNADIGLEVVDLFDSLQIDWEEYLSHVVGDAPAFHVSRFIRGVSNWLNQSEQSLSNNISEYLHEETKWLPSREALQDFFNDIDTIRMDIDRAEAKMANLKNRLLEDEENR